LILRTVGAVIEAVRVLIIDDHPLFREGLKSLLLTLDPTTHVQQCARVLDACALPDAELIELVLLDLNLPGPSRLEALAAVRAHFEAASVVIVSGDDDPATIEACIQAGAAGFIPKDTDPAATVQALRSVTSQGIYLPPQALSARAQRAIPPPVQYALPAPAAEAFSDRQMAVLRSLLQGKSNKLIARDIGIAEGTVKAHLWAVYQRLGVSNRAQAMYRAHELGLIGQLGQGPAPRKKREW
jgi:DNA-binding NarL/FixJ family response regulator